MIITDYNMPGMDGLELVSAMKQADELKDIPIIIISTEGSQERVEAFMEKGAADYLMKPFTPEEIKNKLNNIIGEADHGTDCIDERDEGLDF